MLISGVRPASGTASPASRSRSAYVGGQEPDTPARQMIVSTLRSPALPPAIEIADAVVDPSTAPELLQTSVVCHEVIPELDELGVDTPWNASSRSRAFDAQVRCMDAAIEDGLDFSARSYRLFVRSLPDVASQLPSCHMFGIPRSWTDLQIEVAVPIESFALQ